MLFSSWFVLLWVHPVYQKQTWLLQLGKTNPVLHDSVILPNIYFLLKPKKSFYKSLRVATMVQVTTKMKYVNVFYTAEMFLQILWFLLNTQTAQFF